MVKKVSTYDYAFKIFLGYLAISFPVITFNFALRAIHRVFNGDV